MRGPSPAAQIATAFLPARGFQKQESSFGLGEEEVPAIHKEIKATLPSAERRAGRTTRNIFPATGNFFPARVRFFRVSDPGRRASEAGLMVSGPGRLATGHFLPARDHFFRVNGAGRRVSDVGRVVSDHFLPVSGRGGARRLRD